MGEVISILSRQPIIQSESIRITSSSKPEIVAVRTETEEQHDWLRLQGWELMELDHGICMARNNKFMWGMWVSCEKAVEMQESFNLGRVRS